MAPSSDPLALVPAPPPPSRLERYDGDGMGLSLTDLSTDDRTTIRSLYDTLAALGDAFGLGARTCDLDAARAFLRTGVIDSLTTEARMFGSSRASAVRLPRYAEVVHDVRSGALLALVLLAGAFESAPGQDAAARIAQLVRDHLKIMRSCVLDLDPARTARDRTRIVHDVAALAGPWRDANAAASGGSGPRVVLACEIDSAVAESCLEFAALDRVVYNLVEHAAKCAREGEPVHLAITRVGDEASPSLRIVASCATGAFADGGAGTQGDLATLLEHGPDPVALAIVTEFVANAYGVASHACREARFVGASLGDTLTTWAHWPLVVR